MGLTLQRWETNKQINKYGDGFMMKNEAEVGSSAMGNSIVIFRQGGQRRPYRK